MADFYFPQLKGPDISVSLYGDAATAGTRVGQAIPSVATSIIEGGIQGYATGQKLIENDQQIQINQNTIDRIPETNRQQDAQIKQTEQLNQIRALQIEAAQSTQQLEIDNTKKKLEADNAKLDYQKGLNEMRSQFAEELRSSDPSQQAQLILGQKYQPLFSADPKLYAQQLNSVMLNPNNGLNDEQRKNIGYALRKGQASDYWDREAAKQQTKFEEAKGTLMGQPWISDAASKLKITPEEVVNRTMLVPHGQYQVGAGGRILPDIRAGGWAVDPKYKAEQYKGQYDLVDKTTGQILNGTGALNDKSYEMYNNYTGLKSTVNGTYKAREIQRIDNEQKKARTTSVPPQTQTAPALPEYLSKATPFQAQVAQELQFTPSQFEAVKEPLGNLEQQIVVYTSSPTTRGTLSSIKSYNDTVDTVVRGITDNQFENSDALRAQYTESDVRDYNKSLADNILKEVGGAFGFLLYEENLEKINTLGAYEVKSPSELYYLRQRDALTAKINGIVETARTRQLSKQNSAANTQRATQSVLAHLSAKAQVGVNAQ